MLRSGERCPVDAQVYGGLEQAGPRQAAEPLMEFPQTFQLAGHADGFTS